MDLILEYESLVQAINDINETGLDNKKKIKENNKLADRLRAIASDIDSRYPEMKPEFYQLLFHEKAAVRCWVAHHILEVMNYDDRCRAEALKKIVYISTHDKSINGLGNKMWLKQWFEIHPTDKSLL